MSGSVSSRVGVLFTGDATQLNAAAVDSANVVEASSARMDESIASIGDTAEVSGAKVSGIGASASKISSTLFKFGEAAAAGLAIIGIASIDSASKFDDANKLYINAANDAGESTKKAEAAQKSASATAATYGYNTTEVTEALETFAQSHITGTKAVSDLSTAEDLARAKNISLSDAVTDLTKANAGSTRVLTQMGINLDVGTGKLAAIQNATTAVSNAQIHLKQTQEQVAAGQLKGLAASQALDNAHRALSQAEQKLALDQGTVNKIFGAVRDATKGAAAAYSDTLSGAIAHARASIHDFATETGEHLIPMLTKLLTVGMDVLSWVGKTKEVLIPLAGVVGGVVVASLTAWTVGMVSSAAATLAAVAPTTAFGAAMGGAAVSIDAAALPIAAIVAALAVLGVAIYELVDHWSTVWNAIKDVAADAWHFIDSNVVQPIVSAFEWVVNEISSHWQGLLQILLGPIGLAWAGIQKFGPDVVSFFEGIPHDIEAALSDLGDIGLYIVQGIWNGISNAGSWLYNQIKQFAKSFVENPVKAALSILSPSKVMMGHGLNVAKGLALGMYSGASLVKAASLAMADAATVGVSGTANVGVGAAAAVASGGGSSSGVPGVQVMQPVNLQINGQTIGQVLLPFLVGAGQYSKQHGVQVRLS